jgi:hypothetical protein
MNNNGIVLNPYPSAGVSRWRAAASADVAGGTVGACSVVQRSNPAVGSGGSPRWYYVIDNAARVDGCSLVPDWESEKQGLASLRSSAYCNNLCNNRIRQKTHPVTEG